jgi:hypothetical protein
MIRCRREFFEAARLEIVLFASGKVVGIGTARVV